MIKRVQELLNRKPSRWGNVSVKTFNQDITLLTDTIKEQQKIIEQIANPDMQEWERFKQQHGEGVSFQTFLQSIAQNYLNPKEKDTGTSIDVSLTEIPYVRIEAFIKQRGYTYTVEDILSTYQEYYKRGYYISHSMNVCIEHLETEINALLREKSKKESPPA